MEWIIRASVLCITAGILALVLERDVPGLSLMLGLSATVMVLLLTAAVLDPIMDFLTQLGEVCELSGGYTKPILKCLAIALITKFGASLCKDAKQGGAAAALEFSGAAAAVWTCLPLMQAFLSMLEDLL